MRSTATIEKCQFPEQTTSFIEISTEAGILLGGNGAFRAMMIAHSRARS
jgi:hypothetical protein